jgi:hypothetical protein
MQEHKFQFQVDKIPYMVSVIPFHFNNEKRFRVSYNGGEEDIFVWDADLKRLRAIDDDASTLPDSLGLAISNKIESLGY